MLGVMVGACGRSDDRNGPSSPSAPLSRLELFPARIVVAVGESIEPTVLARDLAGAEVAGVVPSYSSSSPGVVRIAPGGRLLADGIGTATVQASAGGQVAEMVVHVGAATYDLVALGPPRLLDANYIVRGKARMPPSHERLPENPAAVPSMR